MQINQYLVKTACPPSSDTLFPDHRFGVFAKHIARAALLLPVALGATVLLATGCSSTGAELDARLISPVPNNQQATNSEADNWYQPSRSPGFDPDLFGS
jgi:hypothetical protein